MKVCQISWRDILSVLFWDGKICWTAVWRCGIHSLVSPFLIKLPRVQLSLLPTSIWWNECGIWPTKFIRKYYVVWRWVRPFCTVFSLFWHKLPRVWPFLFPTLIWWNECVIWQTKFIGRCYAQQGMKAWRILLYVDSKLAPFLGLRSTRLLFLGTC